MKRKGLLLAIVAIWFDFPYLYYGINNNNYLIIVSGLFLLSLGVGWILLSG